MKRDLLAQALETARRVNTHWPPLPWTANCPPPVQLRLPLK